MSQLAILWPISHVKECPYWEQSITIYWLLLDVHAHIAEHPNFFIMQGCPLVVWWQKMPHQEVRMF